MAGVYKIDKERRQNLRPFRWGAGAFSFFIELFYWEKNVVSIGPDDYAPAERE